MGVCIFLFIPVFTGCVTVHADQEAPAATTPATMPVNPVDSEGRSENSTDSIYESVLEQVIHSFSVRSTFSSFDVIGDEASEEFSQYDIAANFNLPWAWHFESDWEISTRLMTSIGALRGGGETALSLSLIPQIVFDFGILDWKFALDMGIGAAMLSRHRFGEQDFGGLFQFAGTGGLSFPSFKRFRRFKLGYRYLHYSDAGLIGPRTTGADLHMIELIYLL